MRQTVFIILFSFGISANLFSQEIVQLWEGNPSTANEINEPEQISRNGGWISNVTTPELQIYKAKENKDGKAIVICPGGGYAGLAIDHEGKQFAEWFNQQGITAIVLKYRMPNKHKNVPLEDAQQAIRYVRENAKALGINPNKIGIAGFSAGGHLAATASTHYANQGTSTRPDFSILFYPVVTMMKATHGGSKQNLLGDNPSDTDINRFSNEKQVSVNTPPTILLLSDDDNTVLPENSVNYYNALKANGIPATMYIFPEGGHGWGFKSDFKYHEEMKTLLSKWLEKL